MAASESILLDRELVTALAAELSDQVGEILVERVLSALHGDASQLTAQRDGQWLDARQVADRLGVTRDWVYAHVQDLGGRRIGNGTRPRLRFPPDLAANAKKIDATATNTRRRSPGRRPRRLVSIRGW